MKDALRYLAVRALGAYLATLAIAGGIATTISAIRFAAHLNKPDLAAENRALDAWAKEAQEYLDTKRGDNE